MLTFKLDNVILQVDEKALVVGVDMASETQYARAFDNRGIELGKLIRFNNDINGFNLFAHWATEICKSCGKTQVIVGMEPTGHYWFN